MTALQAIQAFWSSFGLSAYDEHSVPYKTEFPYITYTISEDFFDHPVAESVSLWYHSPSWAAIIEKGEQIAEFISRGGRMVGYDGGTIWIKRGSPWAQRLDDPSDDMIRRLVLNIEYEFIQ